KKIQSICTQDKTRTKDVWLRHLGNLEEAIEIEYKRNRSVVSCTIIKYRLREHVRSHTQERLVACLTCGCMFSSNTKFLDHIQRQAEPEESLVCEHCDKGFANERLLRDQVRQHVNHIKCPLCDMTCTSLATLKIHIKFRHCDERPFPCNFCESRFFKNQHDLWKHMETHNEGAVYHCSVEGWWNGHEIQFYHKEVVVDGYLRLNMVRYETVEVTQEIMKNMAQKRTLHQGPGSSSRAKRAANRAARSHGSPPSSSFSCSTSSSDPRGSDSPVYCVLSNVSDMGDNPDATRDGSDSCGPSGAVRALTEVARGLGMDVV
uniref:Zgc:112083 n=1 Tax=Oncorhynchus mykiss TaxID=8022 RepID=A0A8C7S946_ONCMY